MEEYPIKAMGNLTIYGDWDDCSSGQFIVHKASEDKVNVIFLGGYDYGGGVSKTFQNVDWKVFKPMLDKHIGDNDPIRYDDLLKELEKGGYRPDPEPELNLVEEE